MRLKAYAPRFLLIRAGAVGQGWMTPFVQALLALLQYFVAALLLLAAFLAVYVRVTPYNVFELIGQNNAAAAISLAGACPWLRPSTSHMTSSK